MNKIYKEIFKLLDYQKECDIELTNLFDENYKDNKSVDILQHIIELLVKLYNDHDPYAPFYLYRFISNNKKCSERFALQCINESIERGFFRAIIYKINYLLDKPSHTEYSEKEIEDYYLDLTILIVNEYKHLLSLKKNNDKYYLLFKPTIDDAILFGLNHKRMLRAMKANEISVDIALDIAKIDGYFLKYILSINTLNEIYKRCIASIYNN